MATTTDEMLFHLVSIRLIYVTIFLIIVDLSSVNFDTWFTKRTMTDSSGCSVRVYLTLALQYSIYCMCERC